MSIEQSPADSMADRISNQFEPAEQPEQEQQQQTEGEGQQLEVEAEQGEPEFVEVEFKGKKYQVPPELKDGLMAEADYTTKTQEVAEQRRLADVRETQLKAREAERAFETSAREDIVAMQRIDFQIEQYKAIDATGLTSEQLWQLSRTIENLKDEKAKHQNKLNEKWQGFQAEQTKLAGEMRNKALEAAQKSIPNWSPDVQKQIREYAVSQGFEASEVDAIGDPRVAKVLWQASQFQKLQSAKTNGKVTSMPAVKPGSSNPMPQNVKDKFAFNKQMNSAKTSPEKAKVIERELMKRFN